MCTITGFFVSPMRSDNVKAGVSGPINSGEWIAGLPKRANCNVDIDHQKREDSCSGDIAELKRDLAYLWMEVI